jgi:hypothetical protein
MRSLEAIQKKGSRWTKTETGKPHDFQDAQGGPHQADAWPSRQITGIVTDDPKHTKAIVERTSVPWGGQAGTNTAPTRRRAMLALIILWGPGAVDSFKLETGRPTSPPRPYNSINDKAAFDRSINKLANGKTPGLIPFQTKSKNAPR